MDFILTKLELEGEIQKIAQAPQKKDYYLQPGNRVLPKDPGRLQEGNSVGKFRGYFL
jgi:hypothetical protein